MIARRQRIHKSIRKIYGTPHCKKGEVVREGYTRKSFTKKSGLHFGPSRVGPGCIKAVGLSKKRGRKGKQLFTLKKGDLTRYGYHVNKSDKERHEALQEAVKHNKPLSIYRKLNALFVLNKNKKPSMAKLYRDDANWVQTTEEYQKEHPKRGGDGENDMDMEDNDLNESHISMYSDYSIDDLEDEYNKLFKLQESEPAQVEEFPEVKEELIRKYEEEIENLSGYKDIPHNQMEAFDYDYDGQGSFRSEPIDRNEKKINLYKLNMEKVKKEQEI